MDEITGRVWKDSDLKISVGADTAFGDVIMDGVSC